jgi:hypothetical protein
MTTRFGAIFLTLAALPLHASLIDVTSDVVVQMSQNDKLWFAIDISNYRTLAVQFGAPVLPERVEFVLSNNSSATGGPFTAWLESSNGLGDAYFPGTLRFVPGSFQGATYDGPVSTLGSSLNLRPITSLRMFRESEALLGIENDGSGITLGLPPYRLARDMNITVSGGPISVGVQVLSVTLETAGAQVPEPGSAWLIGSGAGLCLLSFFLRRNIAPAASSAGVNRSGTVQQIPECNSTPARLK